MKKTVQAKHVPEAPILAALARTTRPSGWMTHWDYPDANWSLTEAIPELRAFPSAVLLAKLRSMKRRGLIDGCDCGCRGDWHLVERCGPCGRMTMALASKAVFS